jgi:hypothetical protein
MYSVSATVSAVTDVTVFIVDYLVNSDPLNWILSHSTNSL